MTASVTIRHAVDLARVEAVLDDGTVAGFAQYRTRPDGAFTFLHTEVDNALEGQGIGSGLVAGVMDLARQEGFAVEPICPFVRSYMQRHPDTRDLLASGATLPDDE